MNEKKFDDFVVCVSNELAYKSMRELTFTEKYNPLVIYGEHGVGKSHLMKSLQNSMYEIGKTAIIKSVDEFLEDFTKHLIDKTMDRFREEYINHDLFILEDIELLSNKSSTQEEICNILEALFKEKKSVAVTSCSHPINIIGMSDKLKQLLMSGLIVDIQKPDFECRKKIAYQKCQFLNLALNDEMLDTICKNTSLIEINAILVRLDAITSFTQQKMTLVLIEKIVNEFTL